MSRRVVVVVQSGGVEHHAPKPQLDGLVHERGVIGMVEMDGHQNGRRPRDSQRCLGSRRQRTVVPDAVLTDLQYDRCLRLLGIIRERLRVLRCRRPLRWRRSA